MEASHRTMWTCPPAPLPQPRLAPWSWTWSPDFKIRKAERSSKKCQHLFVLNIVKRNNLQTLSESSPVTFYIHALHLEANRNNAAAVFYERCVCIHAPRGGFWVTFQGPSESDFCSWLPRTRESWSPPEADRKPHFSLETQNRMRQS